MTALEFKKLYEPIDDSYVTDYNILTLHQKIQADLLDEDRFIAQLEQKIQQAEMDMMRRQTLINRDQSQKTINQCTEMINLIRSKRRIHDYLAATKSYLNAYEKLSSNITFTDFWHRDDTEPEINYEKLSVIESYLKAAGQFYPLQITHRCKFKSGLCKNCGVFLKKIMNADGIMCCQECGAEHFTTLITSSAKDSGGTVVYNDESKENFLRALTRFEGMQAEKPCAELFVDLDQYFLSLGRPRGSDIRKLPLNSDGTRGDTDHQMLWSALPKINWTQYYEDTNLVGHLYWGWALPQITPEQRSKILEHYDKTQYVFHQIPVEERGRVSSLGTQYRLFLHLRLVGYPCSMKQFKIAENSDSLRIHDCLWEKMCQGTGDPEICGSAAHS